MENIKLATTGEKPTDEDLEGQIMLNIGKKHFSLYHSDNYDVFAVYLILVAAVKHVAKLCEEEAAHEGKYLQ